MCGFNIYLIIYTSVVFSFLTQASSHIWAQDSKEEEVEMLEVFEVPGTAIQRETRQQHFPTPTSKTLQPFPDQNLFEIPLTIKIQRLNPHVPRTVMDPIGKIRGIRTSVKPIKAPRPTYPRFAREQGWQGTSVLRLRIDDHGRVSKAIIQRSSGYPALDDSAIQTVKQWGFLPGKNGEFPVTTVVDIPIRFDLKQPQ